MLFSAQASVNEAQSGRKGMLRMSGLCGMDPGAADPGVRDG